MITNDLMHLRLSDKRDRNRAILQNKHASERESQGSVTSSYLLVSCDKQWKTGSKHEFKRLRATLIILDWMWRDCLGRMNNAHRGIGGWQGRRGWTWKGRNILFGSKKITAVLVAVTDINGDLSPSISLSTGSAVSGQKSIQRVSETKANIMYVFSRTINVFMNVRGTSVSF